MKMIFPLVPTMAAVGIIKGCLAIFLMAGVLQTTDGTFIILQNINDAFLYFLPIIVAFSVAKTFDSNPYVAAAIGASLVFPGIVKLHDEGTALTFLKIPVILTSYGNSIFPVMFSTFIAAKLEKYLERFIPPFLEFLKIMILLLVMVPFTFMVVGPIFVKISELLANGT
ncbi:PTS transporter subunit EIIC, partial [Paenibacillus polymyxa]